MKRLLLFTVVLLLAIAPAAAQFKYTEIACPGMHVVILLGISNNGVMAGAYNTDADPVWHALIIKNGKCIPVAPATLGKVASFAVAPNERGDITGTYYEGRMFHSPAHGFLLDKSGVMTTLDFPTGVDTWAYKITDYGTVVGKWFIKDALGTVLAMHGYVWKDGAFSDVMYPGSADTMVLGINERGESVGSWDTDYYNGPSHGYLYSKGTYTTIDVPFTDSLGDFATDINEKGEIVGQFWDADKTYAYLKVGSAFTRFDCPGSVSTGFEGINNKGQMVGWYYDGDWNPHALLVERGK